MKTYYYFIHHLQSTVYVQASNKQQAIETLRRMYNLAWNDELTCMGINL